MVPQLAEAELLWGTQSWAASARGRLLPFRGTFCQGSAAWKQETLAVRSHLLDLTLGPTGFFFFFLLKYL